MSVRNKKPDRRPFYTHSAPYPNTIHSHELARLIFHLEPWLIGLWKFRMAGKEPEWCCTFCIDGYYYDTEPAETPVCALLRVLATLADFDIHPTLNDINLHAQQ